MHALMIVYCINKSINKCINAPSVVVSRYKVKDDDESSSHNKRPSSKGV